MATDSGEVKTRLGQSTVGSVASFMMASRIAVSV